MSSIFRHDLLFSFSIFLRIFFTPIDCSNKTFKTACPILTTFLTFQSPFSLGRKNWPTKVGWQENATKSFSSFYLNLLKPQVPYFDLARHFSLVTRKLESLGSSFFALLSTYRTETVDIHKVCTSLFRDSLAWLVAMAQFELKRGLIDCLVGWWMIDC